MIQRLFMLPANLRKQRAQLLSRDVLIEQLKLLLSRLKKMKFGRSSEQLDAQTTQLEFNLEEIEVNAAAAARLKHLSTRRSPSGPVSPYRITYT